MKIDSVRLELNQAKQRMRLAPWDCPEHQESFRELFTTPVGEPPR